MVAQPTPVFDAASLGYLSSSPGTVSHTVGSGDDRLLLVQIAYRSGDAPAAVTYDGTALALAVEEQPASDLGVQTWWLLDPPSGTADVEVTFPGVTCSVSVTSWRAVDQTEPFSVSGGLGDSGTGTNANLTVPNGEAGVLVVLWGRQTDGAAAGYTQVFGTEIHEFTDGSAPTGGTMYGPATDGNFTIAQWTGSQAWAACGVHLQPSLAGLFVDWHDNGFVHGLGDDVTARVIDTLGLAASRGRDQARTLTPPMAGRLDVELFNQSRDYSAENTGSPLAGWLRPGHAVRWGKTHDGLTYPLWGGVLDDMAQIPDPMRLSVTLSALGTLSRLVGKTLSTALYDDIRTDEALEVIFAALGLVEDRDYVIRDTGLTTLDWWWLAEEDAFAAACDLWASEGPGAQLYEDARGRIVFESRHYRLLTPRSTTSQATFYDEGMEPEMTMPYAYSAPLRDVLNAATAEAKVREAQALGVVWEYGSTLVLAPNEVWTRQATASDPFTAAVTPAAGTDYTVSVGSVSSVTLDRTSGASVLLTITAGAGGATLTGLQLRAQAVTVVSTQLVRNTVDAAASVSAFGVRQVLAQPTAAVTRGPTSPPLALRTRSEISANVLQDFVNALVGRYSSPRAVVSFALAGDADDARMLQALSREISDRITIVEAQTGLDTADEFYVEAVAQRAHLGDHQAVLTCEKADPAQNYAVWDEGVWDDALWGY